VTNDQNDGEFLTIAEAATRLGVSLTSVRRYVERGVLRAYRRPVGARLYLKAADVADLLVPKPLDRGAAGKP
jgi:excisionase family DNA binding protein